MVKYFFLVFFLISLFSAAQKNIDSCITFPMFSANYMIQVPAGDLAKRFGINSNIGGSFMLKNKQNFLIELNANFIFGNNLKGDATHLFDSISTSNNHAVINENGEYAKVRTFERGFFAGARIGKIISFGKPNTNSGILVTLGGGYLQHKIRIENDGNNAPQILGDYKLGYDKLRYGFAISEFIGYIYFSKSQALNFIAGFEFYQSWTKSGRSWDFNLMKKDDGNYLDLLHSLKVGWIIPIYRKEPQPFYFY